MFIIKNNKRWYNIEMSKMLKRNKCVIFKSKTVKTNIRLSIRKKNSMFLSQLKFEVYYVKRKKVIMWIMFWKF